MIAAAETDSTLPAKKAVRKKLRPKKFCFSATATVSAKPMFKIIVMIVKRVVTPSTTLKTLSVVRRLTKFCSPTNFC